MTVNIAVNLGSHTLFMTDRLRTVSENGVTSRDDEFASKISTVKSGMACHAGRVGIAPIKIIDGVDLSKLTAEIIEKRLMGYHKSLANRKMYAAFQNITQASFMIGVPGADRVTARLFCIKPPGFNNNPSWYAAELGVGASEWAFPDAFPKQLAAEYRQAANDIVEDFLGGLSEPAHLDGTLALDPLVYKIANLLASMAHHSPYVNRNIQIGLVSGNGNRFESDLNMDAQDILEYHLHPKVNFELLNDFRLTALG